MAELSAAEGDVVEPGKMLARLCGTHYQSAVDELTDEIAALDIRRLRLEAEMVGADVFKVPEAFAARVPANIASERGLLAARHSDDVTQVDSAHRPSGKRDLKSAPGVQAEVGVRTGGKTVLIYRTKLLYKSSEALRERDPNRGAAIGGIEPPPAASPFRLPSRWFHSDPDIPAGGSSAEAACLRRGYLSQCESDQTMGCFRRR